MGSQRSTSGRPGAARASRRGTSGAKAPSQRQLRVGEELRHALSRILMRGDLHDPLLAEASLTVTEVRASPDLKNATAFVVPLGGRGSGEIVAVLNRAAAFLRGQVGREMHLRHVPRLAFQADRSFDEADKINALLHDPRVQRDVEVVDRGEGSELDAPQGPAAERPDEKA